MSFIVKYRGKPTPFTIADYYCEQHGRFELEVARDDKGDAPDVVRCTVANGPCGRCGECQHGRACSESYGMCGRPAVWCISAPLTKVRSFEAVKGKSQRPERKTWTDTSAVGEGQPLYDWHEDRAKIWEEKRKADVVAFAREHNERVIGGD